MPLFTFVFREGNAVMVPVPAGASQTQNATAAVTTGEPQPQQEQRDEYWLWHAGVLMSSGHNRSSEWEVEE